MIAKAHKITYENVLLSTCEKGECLSHFARVINILSGMLLVSFRFTKSDERGKRKRKMNRSLI